MEQRLRAVARRRSGQPLWEVAEWAGVHPATVRRWVVAFESGGAGALEERSRRPGRSPSQLPPDLEDMICELRGDEALSRFGTPGARTIREQLRRRGVRVPAASTVHAVLVRRGEVETCPSPAKRPPLRFEAPHPNSVWQLDVFSWALADCTGVEVIDILDDHARKLLATGAVETVTSEVALGVFSEAVQRHGPPAATLTDNAGYFTGRRRGTVSQFERTLWERGVATRNGSPRHPQTQGKIERFHRTAKTYLGHLPRAETLEELAVQLESLLGDYNRRPHSAIGYLTPDERYRAATPALPEHQPSIRETTRKVWYAGSIRYGRWVINLGRRWAGQSVVVTDDGAKVVVSAEDGTHITAFGADTPKGYVAR